MVSKGRTTGRAKSVPAALALAAFVSMFITATASAAIAYGLNREKITWVQAGYWIMGMLYGAALIGGKCAFRSVKSNRFLISAMSGLLYWGLLLCLTALFFGGDYGPIWETAAIIGAGSGTAALILVPNSKKPRIKKGRAYR